MFDVPSAPQSTTRPSALLSAGSNVVLVVHLSLLALNILNMFPSSSLYPSFFPCLHLASVASNVVPVARLFLIAPPPSPSSLPLHLYSPFLPSPLLPPFSSSPPSLPLSPLPPFYPPTLPPPPLLSFFSDTAYATNAEHRRRRKGKRKRKGAKESGRAGKREKGRGREGKGKADSGREGKREENSGREGEEEKGGRREY